MDKFKLLSVCLFALVSFNVHADFRLEAQAGGAQGDAEQKQLGMTFEDSTETGISYGAAAWLDGWLMSNFSIGAQFNRVSGNDLEADGSSESIEFDTDVFMVNFVFRDNAGSFNGKFHPYAGGGIGFARVDADFNLVGINTDGDDIGFAAQVTGGFDYDITNNIYCGVNIAYLFNEAEPDVSIPTVRFDFETIRFMGVLGMKF